VISHSTFIKHQHIKCLEVYTLKSHLGFYPGCQIKSWRVQYVHLWMPTLLWTTLQWSASLTILMLQASTLKFKEQSSFRCACFFLILEMLEWCEIFYLIAKIVTERWNLVIWVCTESVLVGKHSIKLWKQIIKRLSLG